jgi:hypothetical protein
MSWLTVHYSPGFQEDLTSWTLAVDADGQVTQEVDVCRFTPPESRKETYHSRLSPIQMEELRRCIAAVELSLVEETANLEVIDDTEQIQIEINDQGLAANFVAPLAYWSHQKARGFVLSPAQEGAILLWHTVLPLSQYKARCATGA